jgi:hypothetical protein
MNHLYHGKITRVVRDATAYLEESDRGVLNILRTAEFNIVGRDLCHAEDYTVDGEYGQVCQRLRDRRFYVRGPHAAPQGTPAEEFFHDSVEAALAEAMGRLA